MNEIPDLQDDLAFIKKIDPRSNVWKEFDASYSKEKGKTRSNFLLHPKRLCSDSECSSKVNSPRNFLSATILQKFNLQEQNNNIHSRIHHSLAQTYRIKEIDGNYIETSIGDGIEKKALNSETVEMAIPNKLPKVRQVSSSSECFDRKFKNLVERSLKVLTNIRSVIEEGIAPPDGQEDFVRRTKRLQEFSSRFSRIYLYPVLRQTDELSMPEKLGTSVINQKILYAQQLILQGLQAYLTHLPSSVGKCGTDKLRSLLDQIIYMCHLCGLLKNNLDTENCEFINALHCHVELLLEAINNFDSKFTEQLKKSETVKKKGNRTIQVNKMSHSNKNKSKLSMYLVSASFGRDLTHRKAVESLTQKRYLVKSRYKTAGFKHRPPVEKKVDKNPSKIKVFKGSSDFLKSPSTKNLTREEDIKTMVELDSEIENPPNTGEILNHESSIASSKQLVQDSDRDGIEDSNVEKALNVLRKFFGNSAENKQTDFLEKIASEVDKKKEERGDMQEKTDKPKKKLKVPIMTVTGTKNARLICIRDDNSVTEDEDPSRRDVEIMTDVEIKLTSSETQTHIKEDKRIRSNKSAIKISRLPKTNRKLLTVLPKEYAINIIQYKLRYNHFHKHNPMYRKSVHIQPWVLMGHISDEILDHIIQSVAGELEVNEILENLYNAEFQY